jgi:hypothetical protein
MDREPCSYNRPVRYVTELAYPCYFGPIGDMLGFNHLTSAGLDLDTVRREVYSKGFWLHPPV